MILHLESVLDGALLVKVPLAQPVALAECSGVCSSCDQSHLGVVQSASAEGATGVTNPPDHITMATLLL
jgi:hypothetical protein